MFQGDVCKTILGVEKERELFHKIKYGQYKSGSMADYFLKILKEASYLSEPLDELKLTEYVVNHFPTEIKCGILNGGYKNIDDVEQHLRKLDESQQTFIDGPVLVLYPQQFTLVLAQCWHPVLAQCI